MSTPTLALLLVMCACGTRRAVPQGIGLYVPRPDEDRRFRTEYEQRIGPEVSRPLVRYQHGTVQLECTAEGGVLRVVVDLSGDSVLPVSGSCWDGAERLVVEILEAEDGVRRVEVHR